MMLDMPVLLVMLVMLVMLFSMGTQSPPAFNPQQPRGVPGEPGRELTMLDTRASVQAAQWLLYAASCLDALRPPGTEEPPRIPLRSK